MTHVRTRTAVKIIAMVTVFIMAASLGTASEALAHPDYEDLAGHWAGRHVLDWSSLGLVSGYPDGTFRPESGITRAEFFALVNRVFGYESEEPVSFSDVSFGDWFYSDVARAVAAGHSEGYPDGTIRPNERITRQEAAVMLHRAFALGDGGEGDLTLADADAVAAWAKEAVAVLSALGVINGYPDGTFRPDKSITRAEAVVMLKNACGEVYTTAGTYSADAEGNVVVNASGVTLKDMEIAGDLYLAQGIGEGEVVLDGVNVEGTTFVWGGGENSIRLRNSRLRDMQVNRGGSVQVRVIVENNTIVTGIVSVRSSARIETDGMPGNAAPRPSVVISQDMVVGGRVRLSGVFENVTILAPNVQVDIREGSVKNVVLNSAASVSVARGAAVDSVVVEETAEGARIHALAAVQVRIKANNVVVNDRVFSSGDDVRVPEGGGVPFTVRTDGSDDEDDDEGDPVITLVTDIDVVCAGKGATVPQGGTLQMSATVLPETANNRSVEWTVEDGTGSATIDPSGLLTGTGPGTVTVKATAQDGSGVVGALEVTVEFLPVELTGLAENLAASLQPAFGSGAYEYSLLAGHAEDIAEITASLAGATIRYSYVTTHDGAVSDKEVASGSAEAIHLDVGVNVITIEVEKEDRATVTYIITVTRAASSSKEITGFVFDEFDPDVAGAVDGFSISLTVPHDTDVSSLAPAITHTGKSVSPASGAAVDFTAPVTYTVTADDDSTQDYVVTVTRAASNSKEITDFVFDEFDPDVPGAIDGFSISLTVPHDTDVSSLAPAITHTGKSVSPASGAPVDFTAPVTYTVTADDDSTQDYVVTVIVKGAVITVDNLLQVGENTSATASAAEPGATGWTSSDESVATIEAESGVITAVAAGTTTIAYTDSDSGRTNEGSLIVHAAAQVDHPDIAEVRLESASVTPTGFTAPGVGETILWSSSDETKATVNGTTGAVSAVALGEVTISYSVREDSTGLVVAKGHLVIDVLPEGEFWSGTGTETDPWVITKPKHLNNVRNYLGHENDDKYFVLGNDIDLTAYLGEDGDEYNGGEGWRPIGATGGLHFSGHLAGDGHTILGLVINRPESDYQGLFGYMWAPAEIRDLKLAGVQVVGGQYVGAVVAHVHSGAVMNCSVTGSVWGGSNTGGLIGRTETGVSVSGCHNEASVDGIGYVGGLIGYNNGNVADSFNTGTASNTDNYTGGLTGYSQGTINRCYNTGSVSSTGINTGGLVGQVYKGTITASFSAGTVQGSSQRTGGLVGYLYEDSSVTDCYSISSATGGASGTQFTGGLVGDMYESTITNSYSAGAVNGAETLGGLVARMNTASATSSYWDTETSGVSVSACGEGKTAVEMKQQATFVDWNFESVWSIEAGEHGGYPFLQWESGE